ncbi:toll/interleukin-1 receptor domain-containing protein [Bacillus altitudinis]|nr:toll/interleukin-1 receptor domain-containing protein [Bacillus altitudinis]
MTNPKIFISYSWTTDDHEDWVLDLAKRLLEDGVDVTLDKWDLKEGHDKYAFMEQMVSSDEIDRVLIICDSGYKIKADNRSGGVGDETQIITPELYTDIKQGKFIPIVSERDSSGNDFVPAYIKNRIYIDLSNIDTFEDNYEQLLRTLHKVPKHKKPALGKVPSYLSEQEINHYKTQNVLKQMRSALDKNPNRLRVMSIKFQEAFIEELASLHFETVKPHELDDKIVDSIEKSKPLKTDFIEYLQILIEADVINSDTLKDFFEKSFPYTKTLKTGTTYETQFDHVKFLIHELILYSFLFLNKYKYYNVMADLLNAEYDLEVNNYGHEIDLSIFRFYLKSLDYRMQKLDLRTVCLHADLLVERAGKYKKELIDIDILLHYFIRSRTSLYGWFPVTYHHKEFESRISLIKNLKSEKHVDLTKSLFNKNSVEDLKDFFMNFGDMEKHTNSYKKIPHPREYINPDEIATKS